MIIAQKTYKHKVLLLMKVGLAVFMVVVFLAQNARSGAFEASNFVYKKLNANETQYFLNSLNALPDGGVERGVGIVGQNSTVGQNSELAGATQNLNLELLSAQISAHIKTAVEPLLLQEASIVKSVSPSFGTHQSFVNILMYSILLGLIAILLAEQQKLIFKNGQSLKLKKILVSISPRSPNSFL